MRKLWYALILLLVLGPVTAFAQHGTRKRVPRTVVVRSENRDRDCCWGNRFSLEPYGGAMKDAYDVSADGDNTAYLVGVRVGYLLSSRTRLLANLGYSESDDVANAQGAPNYFVYDNTWVFTTAGGEFDVVPGRTSAAIGLQGGVAWRRVDLDGQVGTPVGQPTPDEGFSAQEVIVPSLTLRHRVSSRATLFAGLQDNIFDAFEGPAQHALAVTAGFAFR